MPDRARSVAPFTFRALEELVPGDAWAAVFEERWPHYRAWFLRDGEEARASYAESRRMLRTHMPELVEVYEQLVELAGGGDLAARFLSMVQPPPYLSGCSQAVWTRGAPMLVRNYDYTAARLEGLIWSTGWTGRRVIGTSDCLWGLLDGMNEDGLAVSLTFGGRRPIGQGFGIPLIVRYLLETCTTVPEAIATLERLPLHLAHNLTMVDATGEFVTAYLAPDRPPVFQRTPVATNHQDVLDWPEYTAATRSHEREGLVSWLLEDLSVSAAGFVAAFLAPPLLDTAGIGNFGTLYTAVFYPREGRLEYRWPAHAWPQSFAAFDPGEHTELLAADDPAV